MSPQEEYRSRLAARRTAFTRTSHLAFRISNGRLAGVAGTAACVWLAVDGLFPAWPILISVLIFAALVTWHDRVIRRGERLGRAIRFYEDGIARIEDRWHGTGEPGLRFVDDAHLYSRDLDLFGKGSLFQLLSRARTYSGEEMLAGWLTHHASLSTILLRQTAIAELRAQLDLREALATAGENARNIDTLALGAWASEPLRTPKSWLRIAAAVLSVGIIATGWWWLTGGLLWPFVLVLILKMVLTRPSKHLVSRVVRGVEAPLRDLEVLSDALTLLEQQSFVSPRLVELHTSLISGATDVKASDAIRRLKRLADMLDWRRNAFFAPISAALSWPLHLAAAIDDWRRTFGPHVLAWSSAVAEVEALASLATYSYEHPADPFPEFVEHGPARFEATSLGHPLVDAAHMVRNDVSLTPDVRLLIVSGSNMSGKSTLLRSIGINTVLAMAGAPVRSARLKLTPLAVGASLHVEDSLLAGRSRFYAEITRIRAISDLADQQLPALFLLDELFQGTNSHDRKIGADALLRSLVKRGAIGLATTHDLALTSIADDSGGRIVNMHFEDQLVDGQMVFDYHLRPGPVTHSNALALMKAIGLPVS